MSSKVAPYTATPDSTYGRQSPPPAHDIVTAEEAARLVAEDADFRLLIEEDPASGTIIYRRIDRATGRVVAEFSRDAVLKMRDDAGYVAGEVIRTCA
jgi:flagellar protein FlaG